MDRDRNDQNANETPSEKGAADRPENDEDQKRKSEPRGGGGQRGGGSEQSYDRGGAGHGQTGGGPGNVGNRQ